jgi:hypothetical protein
LQMPELSDHVSPKLDQLISEARNQYCDFMLPLEAFRELEAKIPWTDREHFESQLSELFTGCLAAGPVIRASSKNSKANSRNQC